MNKDENTLVTIINPVMTIINALIMQLEQSLTLDGFFSGILGGSLCAVIPPFDIPTTFMCTVIPPGTYTLPDIPVLGTVTVTIDENGVITTDPPIFEDGSIPCTDFFETVHIIYSEGIFTLTTHFPFILPQSIPCSTITDAIDGQLWAVVETIMLNPLMKLVDAPICGHVHTTTVAATTTTTNPATTTTNAATTTPIPTTTTPKPPVDCEWVDYTNATDHPECFCDGLTLTSSQAR